MGRDKHPKELLSRHCVISWLRVLLPTDVLKTCILTQPEYDSFPFQDHPHLERMPGYSSYSYGHLISPKLTTPPTLVTVLRRPRMGSYTRAKGTQNACGGEKVLPPKSSCACLFQRVSSLSPDTSPPFLASSKFRMLRMIPLLF
ncbi:hypothetical protein VNO77_39248 [Canavalia gladiata]|uniref:Uncharacterized protein n=1 Tax=Canavalia gladiata TaxID=3824 RepID=A0AAN9KAR4_CANGL